MDPYSSTVMYDFFENLNAINQCYPSSFDTAALNATAAWANAHSSEIIQASLTQFQAAPQPMAPRSPIGGTTIAVDSLARNNLPPVAIPVIRHTPPQSNPRALALPQTSISPMLLRPQGCIFESEILDCVPPDTIIKPMTNDISVARPLNGSILTSYQAPESKIKSEILAFLWGKCVAMSMAR